MGNSILRWQWMVDGMALGGYLMLKTEIRIANSNLCVIKVDIFVMVTQRLNDSHSIPIAMFVSSYSHSTIQPIDQSTNSPTTYSIQKHTHVERERESTCTNLPAYPVPDHLIF